MGGVNKVILVGYLGKDPELRFFEGNIAKAGFSLATTEFYKDKSGNRVEQTEWHQIVLWRHMAETAAKILKKGSLIYLEGKIHTRSWTDKEGHQRSVTEIVGENFSLLQSKESNKNTGFEGPASDKPST
jgi:single-strand DNA-binding protein